MSSVRVNITDKQGKFLRSRANRKSFIGGRGSGKSTTLGIQTYNLFEQMPRATWAAAGLSYVQLDAIVVPAIREAMEMHGYAEYDSKHSPWGIYVVGKAPPKHWHKPYKRPGNKIFQYCISFINGFTLRLLSQDNKESHRGLSIDGILVDESATVSFEFVQTVLMPALRSKVDAPYYNHPWRGGFFDFSSASWTIEGNWIYQTEDHYNEMIKARSLEYNKLAKSSIDKAQAYLKENPPTHLFLESTFRDNQVNLPSDYGKKLFDAMDPWKYDVEVENKRLVKLPNSYYHTYNSARHLYSKQYDYHQSDAGVLHWTTNDYHADRPLELSLDFNADICWLLVCQEYGKEFRVINSMFKKPLRTSQEQDKSLLHQLAEWFIEEYKEHVRKELHVYGDPNGNKRSADTSSSNKVFFDQFCDVIKKTGWTIYRKELLSYPKSKDRYALVNTLFGEVSEKNPKVRINQLRNKSFIISLQNTLVKTDKSFSKDKSSEKKVLLREYATDPTDAFDYIVWAKYKSIISVDTWGSSGVIIK